MLRKFPLKLPLAIIILVWPSIGFCQLSKGEGNMITLPGKTIRCYLPQHFKMQSEPPGVVHSESGTFVIVVKVPPQKRMAAQDGLPRSFFEDPRYQILSLNEETSSAPAARSRGRLYTMLYTINGYEFERKTLLMTVGQEQYLIIGNYSTKFKPQVLEEVEKVMANFTIH